MNPAEVKKKLDGVGCGFCLAKWTQVTIHLGTGMTHSCHHPSPHKIPLNELRRNPSALHNTNHKKSRRKEMLEGKRPSECNYCWNVEDNSNSFSDRVFKSTEPWSLKDFDKIKDSYWRDDFNPRYVEVSFSNTCNFACVMCNPTDSSMIYNHWVKDQSSPFVQEYLRNDPLYLEKAKSTGYKEIKYREYVDSAVLSNKHIKMIKLLGGEPLLDKKLLQQLSNIPTERKRKITLQVVTNGSMPMLEKTKELKDFNRILYCVSLEGIGDTQDYARYGSDWKQIEQNILSQLDYDPTSINILTCLQATTVTKIGDLINWANLYKIPFALGELEYPHFLGISAVPDKLKQQTVKVLNTVENYFVSDNSESVALDIKSLIDFISDSRYNKKMHKQFINYLKFYEKGKTIKTFTDVFPEWRPYLEV